MERGAIDHLVADYSPWLVETESISRGRSRGISCEWDS